MAGTRVGTDWTKQTLNRNPESQIRFPVQKRRSGPQSCGKWRKSGDEDVEVDVDEVVEVDVDDVVEVDMGEDAGRSEASDWFLLAISKVDEMRLDLRNHFLSALLFSFLRFSFKVLIGHYVFSFPLRW